MLLCVHGKTFAQMVVEKDICCLQCSKMCKGNVWFAQCCWNAFRSAYHDVSILNDPPAYCMLCHDCMYIVGHLTKLSKANYHEEFIFEDSNGQPM